MKSLIFLFTLGLSFAHAGAPVCTEIYSENKPAPIQVKEISSTSRKMIDQLHASPLPKIFTDAQNTKINWQTFEDLKILRNQVQEYAKNLTALSKAERASELAAFKKHIETDSYLKNLFTKMEAFQKFEYLPTQYELRKKAVEEIISILKLLPQDFRPRVAKVAWDQRRAQINLEAEQFTRDFTASFDAVFAESSGYKDYAEYERAVRAVDDPYYKLAIQIIDNNQLEVAMMRPENGRFWAPKVGFQNQFVTESSGGYYKPSYRNLAESTLTGTNPEVYSAKDAELKPKYATLFTSEDSGVHVDKLSASQYGTDIYYFKISQIEKRLSYTMSDSFNSMRNLGFLGRFIPWERRLLMVPFVVKKLGLVNPIFSPLRKKDRTFFPSGKDEKVALRGPTLKSSSYWEAQIFGRLDLDMVEKFEFQENPPSGEFLKELQKRNIQIFDGRNGKTIPWEPET